MGFAFNPFTGNFDQKGSGGGGSSYLDGEVQNFSALPETLGTPAVDSAYLVREAEGTWLLNRKPAGIYIRTANTGTRASDWTHASAFPDVFNDANLVVYSNGDSSKNLAFNVGGITTGTTRTLTVPDKNITLADNADIPTASSATPQALGVAAAGTSTDFARADHVHAMPSAADVGAAAATHASTHHTGGADAIAPNQISAAWAQVLSNQTITANTLLSAGRNRRITLFAFGATANVDLPYENNQAGDVVTLVSDFSVASTLTIRSAIVMSGGTPLAYTTLATLNASGQSFTFVSNGTATGWSLRAVDTHTHAASAIVSGTLAHERGGLEADVSAYSGLLKISGGSTSAVTVTTAGEALLDDADAAAQRTTLGLGNSATLDTGATAGTVAAGDHTHELNALDATGATDGHVLTADGAGGAAFEAPAASGIAETLLDAKGDLIVASAADTAARLAVGSNGHVLTADSGETTGVKWAALPAGGSTNLWIPASAWIPKTTAGCGVDSRETSTNDQNFDELLFDAGTDEFADALVVMPSNYNNGTITARFYWTAASGSGGVAWAIQGRAFANDDALDTAAGTAQLVTDTLIAADDMHVTSATSAVTIGGTPAANTPIQFSIYRDVSDAADDLAVDARLLGVEIIFN